MSEMSQDQMAAKANRRPPTCLGAPPHCEDNVFGFALSLEAWEKLNFLASVVEDISYEDFAFYMPLFPL